MRPSELRFKRISIKLTNVKIETEIQLITSSIICFLFPLTYKLVKYTCKIVRSTQFFDRIFKISLTAKLLVYEFLQISLFGDIIISYNNFESYIRSIFENFQSLKQKFY